jgi:hypothetical protein
MPELVTDGMRLNMITRRKSQPVAGLGPAQIAWCIANLKGFAWPCVQRLAPAPAPQIDVRV